MPRTLTMVMMGVVAIWLPPSCAPSFAQAPGHAEHHDEYRHWTMPGSDASCCNDQDCRPVRAEQDENGNWTAWVDGRPVQIPASKILPFKAKDGRSHWCGVGEETYCFTAGDVRS